MLSTTKIGYAMSFMSFNSSITRVVIHIMQYRCQHVILLHSLYDYSPRGNNQLVEKRMCTLIDSTNLVRV